MKKITPRVTFFVITLLMLCLLYRAVPVHAAEDAVSPGWHYEDNAFRYYYRYGTSVIPFKSTACIQITQTTYLKTASRTNVFKPGLYYFRLGSLSLSDKAVGSYPLYKLNTDGTLQNCGWYKIQKKPTSVIKNTDSPVFIPKTILFTGQNTQKVYYNGKVFTGIAKKNNCYYKVKSGAYQGKYTGTLKSSYVDVSAGKLRAANQKYYKNGTAFTGIHNRILYSKGYQSDYTGWKKYNKEIYYFKSGKAVTGTVYLKSYGGGSKKYRYTFDKTGALKRDLFTQSSTNYYKKKLKIEVNITTHTITIYMYDSKTGSYDIPLKAFICATSKKRGATKTGNFTLSKGSRTRWFKPKKNSSHYYQYGVFIKGSYSWFHSEYYRSRSIYNLNAKIYNGLGTNQTSACIRVQAINAKLIYDIAGKNPYTVPVHIFRSSNKGALGQVVLDDTTGALPLSQKYDPTDPLISSN